MNPGDITAVILAGGRGTRLGGIDKGWFQIGGRSLIEITLERVASQVGPIVVSANRTLDRYRALGVAVVQDRGASQGPLSGMLAGLRAATTPYVLCVPCDTPDIPPDLGPRLFSALGDFEAAVVQTSAGVEPLHALMRRGIADDLGVWLDEGGRAAHAWWRGRRVSYVTWPAVEMLRRNINTWKDAMP